MFEKNRLPRPQEIANLIEATSGHSSAARLILSGAGQDVKSHCGTFATEELADWLNDRDLGLAQFSRLQTIHQRPVGGLGHAWVEDDSDGTLIDPTAGQFLAKVALEFSHLFAGNMFIGTRDQLEALVTHPETQLTNISTASDKQLSLGRIWGK